MGEKNEHLLDVLIIDNIDSQARWIAGKLTALGLTFGIHMIRLDRAQAAQQAFPATIVRKAAAEVRRLNPHYVLIDICLFEGIFLEKSPRAENSGTWTGPALMAALIHEFPRTRFASHSAYPMEAKFTDIEEQRIKWGVKDTPHFSTLVLDQITDRTRFEAAMRSGWIA